VCVDSESAVKIVNLGKEIGSGSVSISSTGEELEDPTHTIYVVVLLV